MSEYSVSDSLAEVRGEIAEACKRAGRNPADVALIAVSKTKPVSMINEAMEAGQTLFGENKVQEMCEKSVELQDTGAVWHLIGHLQKNKVRKAVAVAAMIHSVDSLALAAEISKEAARIGKVQDILLEVNVAEEDSKFEPSSVRTHDGCSVYSGSRRKSEVFFGFASISS